jgi:hypothetical protein
MKNGCVAGYHILYHMKCVTRGLLALEMLREGGGDVNCAALNVRE